MDGFVGIPRKGGIAVGIGIDSHGGDVHLFRGTHDTQRNFSAIGDQDLLNGLNAGIVHNAEVVKNRRKEKGKKKGKRFLSHRYNRLPLLPSGPGGVDGSWS